MAIKGLALLVLLTFALHNVSVSEARDCSFTWFGVTSEMNSTTIQIVFSKTIMNHNVTCPNSDYDNPKEKEYCCYHLSGQATCCDTKQFIYMVVFYICLIMIAIFIVLMCNMFCSCCSIFKQKQYNNNIDFVPLIPNEYFSYKVHEYK